MADEEKEGRGRGKGKERQEDMMMKGRRQKWGSEQVSSLMFINARTFLSNLGMQ